MAEVCKNMVESMSQGEFVPIALTEYPVHDYLSAFRLMQQGKHTGKIVLNLTDTTLVPVVDHRPLFSPEGTYLVTGGLGGFGLRLLSYLYSNGVRNLLLTDSDATRSRTVEYVKHATQIGSDANVTIEYADVSKYEDVERVVKLAGSTLPPLKGVFHLAGVSDGGTLISQNTALYQKTLGAKAQGALNLHKATQQHSPTLTHFVLISSVASALGSAGQANYAAANAFLDSLARHRRAAGLCGTAYNMGGISDVGMAAKDPLARRALRTKGINLYISSAALAGLDYQIRNNITQMVSANFNLDLKLTSPWGYCNFGLLSKNNLSEAVTMSHNAVLNMVCKQVTKLTGASEVPPTQPLSSFGFDSMMATEFSIWLKDKFNLQVSAISLMSAETCESVTQKILSNHNNSSSSSSSSIPSALLATSSQEDTSLLGVETEFVDSQKIFAQFSGDFTKTQHTFTSAVTPDSIPIMTGSLDKPDEVVPETKKETTRARTETFSKDTKEFVQQDIEDICSKFADHTKEMKDIPTPVKEFQNIFLTGAAGFIGRVILAQLLKNNPQLKVTCLVRAEDSSTAMARIKSAMESGGYWQDAFVDNIIAVASDLSQDRFGQSEEYFNELCKTQHAVFHFETNISLTEPYSALQNDHTLAMLQILRLCSTFTTKPLFHLSSLAVFPEYVVGFPPLWPQKELLEEADNCLLEKFASPKEMGYPWCKWASEQIASRCCQLANIPLVIYRIPLLSMDADTGFVSDITMMVAIAALQEGVLPAFGFLINYSDMDIICEVILGLALNSQRKHSTYHIISKEVHHFATLWRWMNEAGYEVKYISDGKTFLETAKKPSSPLRSIIFTLELILKHWFRGGKRMLEDPIFKNGLPISSKNAEEDYKKVAWPRAELGYVSAFHWMLKQGDKWKYPLPKINLQMESVLQHVQSFTGLSTMGPNTFYEPLTRLFEALNTEANLKDIGTPVIRQDICKRLLNRQHLFKAIRAAPEILQLEIKKPVFIIGLPGSGTTFLHRFMSEDPRYRAPSIFEMQCSVVRNEKEIKESHNDSKDYSTSPDPRLRKAYAEWQARSIQAEAMGLELEELASAGSDYAILEHDIQCPSWSVACDIPSFRSWLVSTADMGGTYAFHKLFLQFLQHQGRNILTPGPNNYSWVLEFPMHMLFMKHILETYPDAIFIQVHRPPAEAISAWCEMVAKMRQVYSDKVDKKQIGQSQLKEMQEMLESVLNFRAEHPELADKFFDVKYHDFVEHPTKAIENLYKRLQVAVSKAQARQFLNEHPALVARLRDNGPVLQKHAKMPLVLEEFGLSKEQVDTVMAKYIQQFGL
eukprot:Phypoly_transcript_00642.p1 GENE.Phypoly_transcript_00642~~Phypoly_transcript_00642.p1  ORF type:complete len:1425 (+),score=228.18 Phypoly_transcript_00642:309-4277(+)